MSSRAKASPHLNADLVRFTSFHCKAAWSVSFINITLIQHSFIRGKVNPLGNRARVSEQDAAKEADIQPYSDIYVKTTLSAIMWQDKAMHATSLV